MPEQQFSVNASYFNTSSTPQQATWSSNFNQNLMENPSEWECTVSRLCVETRALPCYINRGDWNVTFGYSGQYFQQVLTQLPSDGNSTGDAIKEVYTPKNFIRQLNNALQLAHNGLSALVGGGYPATVAPKVVLEGSNFYSLVTPITGYSQATAQGLEGGVIQIFVSQSLYRVFEPFGLYRMPVPFINQRVFLVQNLDTGFNHCDASFNVFTSAGTSMFCRSSSLIGASYDIFKLNVLSNLLPCVAEYTGNKSETTPIVFDLIVPTDNLNSSLDYLTYDNISQNRYFNLISTTPLRSLDLFLTWESLAGEKFPLNLPIGASFSVKLLFIKR